MSDMPEQPTPAELVVHVPDGATPPPVPVVANYYRDGKRSLYVSEVAIGDPLGREVRGLLNREDTTRTDPGEPYSCTLVHWATAWNA